MASIKFSDIKDYIDDLKKHGFTDEEKLRGMFNRAVELAKEKLGPDAPEHEMRKAVIGIMQKFMQESASQRFMESLLDRILFDGF